MNLSSSRIVGKTLSAALLASSSLVSLMVTAPARAQLLNQFLPNTIYGTGTEADVTVTSRIKADYNAGGIRAGGYIIRPQLNQTFGYESNVLGQSQATGSSRVSTNAALGASSDNSRGNVSVGASVYDTRYIDLPNQSYTNWNAQVSGSYNLGRDTASVLLSHDNQNQTQLDLDVPRLSTPLPFVIDTFRTDYRANFNRLSLSPTLEIARYAYNSGFSGTTVYDQGYRNRIVLTPGVVAAYEFATRRSAVVIVRNSVGLYSRGTATNPKRDFNDTSVLGGLDYDLNGILRLRGLIGYESRTFSSATFQTIQAPIAELTLIYNPTALTSINATLSRRIQDSADETTAGVTNFAAQIQIDHELRRNVILTGIGAVTRNDYSLGGSQIQYSGGIGGSYLLNRFVSTGVNYDVSFRNGSSSNTLNLNGFPAASNYVDHRISLQLKLAL